MRLAAASPEPTTGTGTVYLRGFRPTYLAGCLRLNNIRVLLKVQCTSFMMPWQIFYRVLLCGHENVLINLTLDTEDRRE